MLGLECTRVNGTARIQSLCEAEVLLGSEQAPVGGVTAPGEHGCLGPCPQAGNPEPLLPAVCTMPQLRVHNHSSPGNFPSLPSGQWGHLNPKQCSPA